MCMEANTRGAEWALFRRFHLKNAYSAPQVLNSNHIKTRFTNRFSNSPAYWACKLIAFAIAAPVCASFL
jgi:hypothetical protein